HQPYGATRAGVRARGPRVVPRQASRKVVGDTRVQRAVTAAQHVHRPHPTYSNFASRVICRMPASAFDTGHPRLASSAAFWNPACSRPGTRPCTLSSILVILGAPSTISRVHAAVVSTRVTGFPAFSRPADRAMLKQAACAAAISSSGFVPFFPSNRVANVYGPLNELLPALKFPFPSLSLPSPTDIA